MKRDSERILAEKTGTGSFREPEWAWKPDELPAVFAMAKQLSFACIGGQPQFRLPDGICELYWIDVDPEELPTGETWDDHVNRSNEQCQKKLREILYTTDFMKEAMDWAFVRKRTIDKGINPLDYLVFVFYFNSENE